MIKRPLVLFICCFILGICAAIFNLNIFNAAALLMLCVLPLVLCRKINSITAFVMLVFFVSGVVRMNFAQKNTTALCTKYNSLEKNMSVLVTDFSDGKNTVGEFKDNEKTIKVYLTLENEQRLYPGDIISGEFSLRTPFASKIKKSDFSSYLKSRGIYLEAYAQEAEVTGSHADAIRGSVFSLRRYIDSLGVTNFEGEAQALFNAMILGDKSKMSDSLTSKLQGAGLNHIAVVSGMHLSVMLAAVMFVINRIFGKHRSGALLSIIAAVFITLVTGCGASVVRACVMCVIYQLARMLRREGDSFTSLAIAGGIMCLYNPYTVFNAGFILSVLSVLGIILYSEKINGCLIRFLPEKISNAASLCICAQIMVTPAVMFYFNIFTPYALLGNVLIFAFVSSYVTFGIAFCAFAYIPVLGDIIKLIVKLSGEVIEYVCTWVSGIQNAVIDTQRPDALFLVFWIFILLVIYSFPEKRKMLMPLTLTFALVTLTLGATQTKTEDTIRFLSVTYGEKTTTAALLPQDKLLLIDCADKWDMAQIASHFEKEAFDYALVTSDDEIQMTDIIKSGYVKNLILPSGVCLGEKKAELINMARGFNVRISFLKNGEYTFSEGVFIEYLPIGQISNEGCGVKIEYKGKSYVSLQGLSSKQIQKLCDENVRIHCSLLKLPFTV